MSSKGAPSCHRDRPNMAASSIARTFYAPPSLQLSILLPLNLLLSSGLLLGLLSRSLLLAASGLLLRSGLLAILRRSSGALALLTSRGTGAARGETLQLGALGGFDGGAASDGLEGGDLDFGVVEGGGFGPVALQQKKVLAASASMKEVVRGWRETYILVAGEPTDGEAAQVSGAALLEEAGHGGDDDG